MTDYVDLVIVGGGLVGLSLGCSLSGSDWSVLVVEAGATPVANQKASAVRRGYKLVSGFSPRVSAISSRSGRFLKHLHVWEKLTENQLSPYHRMLVWDASGTGEIEFHGEQDQPQGYIIENVNLLHALWETVSAASNIELLYADSIVELKHRAAGRVGLELGNGKRLEAGLVVGADGANSLVARYAGLRKREWSYGHQALVTVVETEKSHRQTAWQCFTPVGPLAFLPLNETKQNYCAVVWSMEPSALSQVMGLNDEALSRELTRNFESRLGQVRAVDERHCFPLIQRHARKYFTPGVTLIGDAAHTIHPLAGQGVNLGFSDARTLGKILRQRGPNQKDPGFKNLLRKYQLSRQPENLGMMALMQGFKQLYGSNDPTVNWVRNSGMRLLQKMPGVKRQIIKAVGGD